MRGRPLTEGPELDLKLPEPPAIGIRQHFDKLVYQDLALVREDCPTLSEIVKQARNLFESPFGVVPFDASIKMEGSRQQDAG